MRETSIEVSGRTEEDAIQKALTQIGLERDDVSVEILARPKPGFLGIGGSLAVVKVTYETDEPAPEIVATATEEPAPKVKKTNAVPASSPVAAADDTSPLAQASRFLTGLFPKMNVPDTTFAIEENEGDGRLSIELFGPNMGTLIGRRGETLDSIQFLTGYVINRDTRKERTRVHVNTEGYRERREEALSRLAKKTADKVIRNRRNVSLEPMNAYERHVVHSVLQEVPYISTHSAGGEPRRRVIVAYDSSKIGEVVETVLPESEPIVPATETETTSREWA